MIENKYIAVIGTGHLGSAFVRGLIKSGYPAHLITVSNRDPSKRERLVSELGVVSSTTNAQAIQNAEIIVLAVKPQFMQDVCQEIAPVLKSKNALIISLVVVISIENMKHWLHCNQPKIVRVMTNTPTEFCKGTSALYASSYVTEEQRIAVETIFNMLAYTFWVDEECMIDTLTAPIGSAPAYVFLCLEALQKAAISRGINEAIAEKIALESVLGAAELASKSGRSFAQLREGVTTPNGITAHSLTKLSINDFFDSFKQIYAAAEERIEQITDSLKKGSTPIKGAL